jgi:RNA polymerase sigma-70 factor, ECF subfamily
VTDCGASFGTSSSLLARAKSQDADAWGRLVDLYGPLIYRWVRQQGLAAEDAADIVQEVFTSVAIGIGGFRGDQARGSFRAWLRTIARNKIHDHFRRHIGRAEARGGTVAQQQFLQVPEPAEPSAAGGESPELEDGLWRRALEGVRSQFEQRTWQAFWRVVVEERSAADVAVELNTTLDVVYQAKSRVLRRLRQEMGDLEPTDG